MKFIELTFEEILPYWQKLWADRKSKIEPINGMLFLGGYDPEIPNNSKPIFYGIEFEGKIVGVNSIFQTTPLFFRSRGLYVDPDFRHQKVGLNLLNHGSELAKKLGATKIWSLPRQSALPVYLNSGYITEGNLIISDVEFGPNIYAIKSL